jgi:D-alanyl-D-alanine carboxypeptidase
MEKALATTGQGREFLVCRTILLPTLLAVALVLTMLRPGAAAPVNAHIVIDAASGQVLLQSNADAITYPASLTKMMTLYLLFEALQKGDVKLDQPLAISSNAANKPSTNLALSVGDTITVREAISAMIIHSANDAATVVAEAISGSEMAFAQKMNVKAQALGMTRSFFRNANGLPDPLQHTTARDIATLAMALHRDFPQFYPLFCETRFSFNGRSYITKNRLLLRYPGTDGLKTGYIHLSGFNLATSAVRNGRRLFAVILGGRSRSQRDAEMWALLDAGFGTITPKTQNNNALLLAEASSLDVMPSLKPDNSSNVLNLAPQVLDPATTAGQRLATTALVIPPAPGQHVHAEIATESPPRPVVQASAPTASPIPLLAQRAANVESGVDAGVADDVLSRAISGNRFWGLQVGIYVNYALAHQAAIRAQQSLPSEIHDSQIVVDETPARCGNKKCFRARLAGLAQSEALDACRRLLAQQVSCLVVQSPVAFAMSSGQ